MTTLFDIGTMFEALKSSIETAKIPDVGKIEPIKEVTLDEGMQDGHSLTDVKPEQELQEVQEVDKYMSDDIGLKEKTAEFGDPDYIGEIRHDNEKINQVLSRAEASLQNDSSDLNYQRVSENLERYKGTIFEHELKDSLKDKFEIVEDKQQIVSTEWGETKPDVVLRGAQEDIRIGGLEIKKGEDLYIEAKCGSPEYIRNEMGHILKQVEGHEGNSLVVVTKDYLELSPEVRADFEKKLAEKGSHIYVADVTASEVSTGLFNSLRL
ncbi:hypothetical protein [Neobacillus citreus]|uniref:Uncharacterized protein n=2 Tax=Neobacillus citreus TaxID=2833578 RepID=A0A9J6MTJ1_9BACI|nr:hypothetical protein [Neobacillus citreus]MCH6266994.1 hypothetical protein [Neobacillus citreus]